MKVHINHNKLTFDYLHYGFQKFHLKIQETKAYAESWPRSSHFLRILAGFDRKNFNFEIQFPVSLSILYTAVYNTLYTMSTLY